MAFTVEKQQVARTLVEILGQINEGRNSDPRQATSQTRLNQQNQ